FHIIVAAMIPNAAAFAGCLPKQWSARREHDRLHQAVRRLATPAHPRGDRDHPAHLVLIKKPAATGQACYVECFEGDEYVRWLVSLDLLGAGADWRSDRRRIHYRQWIGRSCVFYAPEAALPKSWCSTKLLNLAPLLQHPTRERFDQAGLILV